MSAPESDFTSRGVCAAGSGPGSSSLSISIVRDQLRTGSCFIWRWVILKCCQKRVQDDECHLLRSHDGTTNSRRTRCNTVYTKVPTTDFCDTNTAAFRPLVSRQLLAEVFPDCSVYCCSLKVSFSDCKSIGKMWNVLSRLACADGEWSCSCLYCGADNTQARFEVTVRQESGV